MTCRHNRTSCPDCHERYAICVESGVPATRAQELALTEAQAAQFDEITARMQRKSTQEAK